MSLGNTEYCPTSRNKPVHILLFHWGWGCRPCSIPSPQPPQRKRRKYYLTGMCNFDGCSDQLGGKFCSMAHLHRNPCCSWCRSPGRNMSLHCSAPLGDYAPEPCRLCKTQCTLLWDLSFHHILRNCKMSHRYKRHIHYSNTAPLLF